MAFRIAHEGPLSGRFRVPASKPETQRALVMAALADGVSTIHLPLHCAETSTMMRACRAIGAEITQGENEFQVVGRGCEPKNSVSIEGTNTRYVWAGGSALVGRLFTAIGSSVAEPVVVDGNNLLRNRPFEQIFSTLSDRGTNFHFFDAKNSLPCLALSRRLPGGRYRLETSVSSQFATALMVPAPLAAAPTTIEISGTHYSLSYIRQTADMMRRFGIDPLISEDERVMLIPNTGCYRSCVVDIAGDYTSASYLLGAAFVSGGRVTLSNLDPQSLQGERAIVDIIETLGGRVEWQDTTGTVEVDCTNLPAEVDASFDFKDSPNILPTVAAMAATIPGRVRLTGGRLTQYHKSPRIDAMAVELAKAGVSITVLRDAEGAVDGLEIRGTGRHRGGLDLFGYGDHRIVMSLVVFALSCKEPCYFDSIGDAYDSFPEFFKILSLSDRPREDKEPLAHVG